jgi:enterochelin esterase family protein
MFSTKTTSLIIFFLFITNDAAVSQSTQSFNGLIQRIAAEEPSKRSAIVDSFMIAQKPKGFPISTDSMAYFVYRGKVDSAIAVTGDYTQWSATGDAMSNVSATDLFYTGRKFEPDARIDYKFIKDGNWILDPLNGHIVSGGFGRNSELAMPSYLQPATIRYDPAIPHGTLSTFVFTSSSTGDSRKVTVYLPPHYDSSSLRYPSIYVHDGPDYLSLASMADVLDNLIEAKQTRPIIGVFIPSGADRAGEYRLAKISQFTKMIVKELVPYVDSVYRTDARASGRGTMGSSDGGHIAMFLAVNNPGTFGLVGGQSSTITDLIREPVRTGPKIPVKFYIDVGTYDISSESFRLLQLNREFRDLLVRKGYAVTYAEYHEGHSWGNWRAHTGDILRTLFPYTSPDVNARKGARKKNLSK